MDSFLHGKCDRKAGTSELVVYTFLGLHGILLCGWYDVCFGPGRIGDLGNVLFGTNAEVERQSVFSCMRGVPACMSFTGLSGDDFICSSCAVLIFKINDPWFYRERFFFMLIQPDKGPADILLD